MKRNEIKKNIEKKSSQKKSLQSHERYFIIISEIYRKR